MYLLHFFLFGHSYIPSCRQSCTLCQVYEINARSTLLPDEIIFFSNPAKMVMMSCGWQVLLGGGDSRCGATAEHWYVMVGWNGGDSGWWLKVDMVYPIAQFSIERDHDKIPATILDYLSPFTWLHALPISCIMLLRCICMYIIVAHLAEAQGPDQMTLAINLPGDYVCDISRAHSVVDLWDRGQCSLEGQIILVHVVLNDLDDHATNRFWAIQCLSFRMMKTCPTAEFTIAKDDGQHKRERCIHLTYIYSMLSH